MTGFGAGLRTARIPTSTNAEGRPMTSVRAAGYSSRGRTPGPGVSFDPFVTSGIL